MQREMRQRLVSDYADLPGACKRAAKPRYYLGQAMQNQLQEGRVVRRILVILVSMVALLYCMTRTPTQADDSRFVSISLPSNVPSETVQISYYLLGPFGGYGGYVVQQVGVSSYEVPATVEGKAATEIRVVVYASGCEIQKFVIPLTEDFRVSREFPCQRVETVKLSGQIVPNELASGSNTELIVTYMAHWAHSFFGIADGPVTQFRLATVSPHADGLFEVNLPLFSQEATPSDPRASMCLMLRDAKTWSHIASNLEPDVPELRSEDRCLRIRTAYPSDINFTALHFERLCALKGKVFRSDSGQAISDSYILLANGEKHFDTRTDEAGNFVFGHLPAGSYTVSVYAWFAKRGEVPSRNPLGQKTADGWDITVEWQRKSHAFMEVVTIKGFSIRPDWENVKDFDLVGN
jgi:hypothetical protein